MSTKRTLGRALAMAALVTVTAATTAARADVQRLGAWPAADRNVSLDVEQMPLRLALRRLADAAGWSLVLPAGLDEPVDVQVRDQPADQVLEMLLAGRAVAAQRRGDMIQLSLSAAAPPGSPPAAPALPASPGLVPPAPPAPPAPPGVRQTGNGSKGAASGDAEEAPTPADRTVTGSSARVEKDETVRNLVVVGGSVEILGTVTEDVSVLGGAVRVRPGGRVKGNVLAMGGSARADEGALIDGHMRALGGVVQGASRARGSSTAVKAPTDGIGSRLGSSMTSASMLFLLGAVLWPLQTARMEKLQVEVARRPMRTFAVGVVSLLGGSLLLLALCVTLVGIPVAVVAALAGVLAAYAGLCATLQVVGKALLGHRTTNPYAHLALGCVLLVVAGYLPWVGDHVAMVAAMVGLGAAVTTGFGGLTRPLLAPSGQGPYRQEP